MPGLRTSFTPAINYPSACKDYSQRSSPYTTCVGIPAQVSTACIRRCSGDRVSCPCVASTASTSVPRVIRKSASRYAVRATPSAGSTPLRAFPNAFMLPFALRPLLRIFLVRSWGTGQLFQTCNTPAPSYEDANPARLPRGDQGTRLRRAHRSGVSVVVTWPKIPRGLACIGLLRFRGLAGTPSFR